MGFTLLELLVVVAVIAIIAALTLGALGGVQQKAARERTSAEITAIANALERYRMQNDKYPPAGPGDTLPVGAVTAFMEVRPESLSGERMLDPFGNPYFYRPPLHPNLRNIATFDVWSGGPTAAANDDIGNW